MVWKEADIKNRLRAYSGVGAVALLALVNVILAPTGFAFERGIQDGADAARGQDQAVNLFGDTGIFTTITNVLLFIVGAIAVIMIVIGGLRYVISGGNSGNVTAAKNTILYAVVGLIIAIMAYAIINFVIGSFIPGTPGGGSGTDV